MTEASIVDEARRLVSLAEGQGIRVRVLGGVAVALLVPDWRVRADRPGRDLDLATDQRGRKAIGALLEAEGYTPDRRYNGIIGHKQLYFVDVPRERPVDVLIDRMEMCHTFEFAKDLDAPGPALPVADLLLSKLQILKINRKDILDSLVLLSEFPQVDGGVGEPASGAIDVDRILRYTSSDWGWWRTTTGNLEAFASFMERDLAADDLDLGRASRFDVASQVAELRRRIDAAPKSMRWRARAAVGDRVPWYEEPEEEPHD